MFDFFCQLPTFRGLSAESSNVGRFLDPADKPRDVGSKKVEHHIYEYYLEKLEFSTKEHGCEIHSYVLMTNHVHLWFHPVCQRVSAK